MAIYGTTKNDHGTFSVKVDSDAPLSATTKSNSGAAVPAEVFRRDGLDPTQTHKVVYTSTQESAWLDLDYIVYETLIGAEE